MRYIAFLFMFFGIFSMTAQETINQFDANGKRHGVWQKTYPDSKQIRYTGTFEHGKEVGTFKFYCEKCKDKPTAVKQFKADSNISQVQYFTPKGKLVSEGKMDGKDRVGEWVYYHKNSSQVMTREFYKNDKLDGLKQIFFPNGEVTEELIYVDGVLEGGAVQYGPSGTLILEVNYKNDKLHGPAKYYSSGKLEQEGHYKNGKKDGVWKIYKNEQMTTYGPHPPTQVACTLN